MATGANITPSTNADKNVKCATTETTEAVKGAEKSNDAPAKAKEDQSSASDTAKPSVAETKTEKIVDIVAAKETNAVMLADAKAKKLTETESAVEKSNATVDNKATIDSVSGITVGSEKVSDMKIEQSKLIVVKDQDSNVKTEPKTDQGNKGDENKVIIKTKLSCI